MLVCTIESLRSAGHTSLLIKWKYFDIVTVLDFREKRYEFGKRVRPVEYRTGEDDLVFSPYRQFAGLFIRGLHEIRRLRLPFPLHHSTWISRS